MNNSFFNGWETEENELSRKKLKGEDQKFTNLLSGNENPYPTFPSNLSLNGRAPYPQPLYFIPIQEQIYPSNHLIGYQNSINNNAYLGAAQKVPQNFDGANDRIPVENANNNLELRFKFPCSNPSNHTSRNLSSLNRNSSFEANNFNYDRPPNSALSQRDEGSKPITPSMPTPASELADINFDEVKTPIFTHLELVHGKPIRKRKDKNQLYSMSILEITNNLIKYGNLKNLAKAYNITVSAPEGRSSLYDAISEALKRNPEYIEDFLKASNSKGLIFSIDGLPSALFDMKGVKDAIFNKYPELPRDAKAFNKVFFLSEKEIKLSKLSVSDFTTLLQAFNCLTDFAKAYKIDSKPKKIIGLTIYSILSTILKNHLNKDKDIEEIKNLFRLKRADKSNPGGGNYFFRKGITDDLFKLEGVQLACKKILPEHSQDAYTFNKNFFKFRS